MTRVQFHSSANFYLCLLIAFFLPVYINFVPPLIGLLAINWLVEGNFSEKFFKLKSNKLSWVFISFYLLYLTGILWTENKESGWFDLQIKLSLLIFPLIFSSENILSGGNLKKVLFSFVAGNFAEAVICFSNAFYIWFKTGENCFTYSKLSIFLHPSYFAMYICFSIAIIFYYFLSGKKKHSALFTFLILFFCFVLIMLQSKAGFIIAICILLFFSFRSIFYLKQITQPLAIILGAILIYWLINSYVIVRFESRINVAVANLQEEKIDIHTGETSQVRILIWKIIPEIIKENNFIGAGTGDVNDVLQKKYNEKNMEFALEHKLNAHNQFLQTAVAIGIPGFLLLVFCFLLPLIISFRKKNILLFSFLIIIILNFLAESMLETQAGVMFYAFFNSLLLFSQEEKV